MAATGTIFDRYRPFFQNFEKVCLRIGDLGLQPRGPSGPIHQKIGGQIEK